MHSSRSSAGPTVLGCSRSGVRSNPRPPKRRLPAGTQHGAVPTCRVLNTACEFAATSDAVFIQAVVDGPKEGSTFDEVLRPTVHELMQLVPGPATAATSGAVLPLHTR